MSDDKIVFSVSQFARQLSGVLFNEFGLVRIVGEVAAFTRASSGHWYFSLKDEQAQVRAVMFRQRNVLAGFLPVLGDRVEILAQVGLYEPRGELQLVVESIRHAGQGNLYEQFLRLKAKLAEQGLFDAARKRPLPKVAFDVAIVTSAQAAALADIQKTLARRAPHVRYVLYACSVQGREAIPQIVKAIERADAGGHEVVLVARGGGSLEDLWCFNEEAVVRAVAACKTPTVVGVGHESDVCLAEFAADCRASTPTAAAEMVSLPTRELLDDVQGLQEALLLRVRRVLERLTQHTDRLEAELVTPTAYVQSCQQRLQHSWDLMRGAIRQSLVQESMNVQRMQVGAQHVWDRTMERAVGRFSSIERGCSNRMLDVLQRMQFQFERAEGALDMLSPQRNLDKGYAFLQKQEGLFAGQVVSSVAQVAKGEVLKATLSDGALLVNVVLGK